VFLLLNLRCCGNWCFQIFPSLTSGARNNSKVEGTNCPSSYLWRGAPPGGRAQLLVSFQFWWDDAKNVERWRLHQYYMPASMYYMQQYCQSRSLWHRDKTCLCAWTPVSDEPVMKTIHFPQQKTQKLYIYYKIVLSK